MNRLHRMFEGAVGPGVALLALWITLASFCALRFGSQSVRDISAPVVRPALTERVALVVLDGLRPDRFETLMSQLDGFTQRDGVFAPVVCPELTFTATGVYTLATGDAPTLSLLPGNFQAQPAHVDSLPWSVSRSGKRALLFGESVWRDLFGAHLDSGVEERDEGPYASAKSGDAFSGFAAALEQELCELCIWHDPTFDKLGHRKGIFSKEYESYARSVDRKLAHLVTSTNSRTTWVITSDHGMTDAGNHGGGDAKSRSSLMAAFGPGVRQVRRSKTIDQRVIPAFVSALLGVPIPFSAARDVPLEFFAASSDYINGIQHEFGAQQRRLAQRLSFESSNGEVSSLASKARIHEVIDAAHRGAPRALLLLSLVPALALLFLSMMHKVHRWPVSLLCCGGILAIWTLAFENMIYPLCSFSTATALYFAVLGVLASVFFFWQRRSEVPNRVLWGLAFLSAVLLTVDAHWIAFLEPAILVVLAWAAWSHRSKWQQGLIFLVAAAACYALTVAGWLRYVGAAHEGVPAPLSVLWGMMASGLYGYFQEIQDGPVSRRVSAGAIYAGLYYLSTALPVEIRPFWPIAVMLAVVVLARVSDAVQPRLPLWTHGALALYAVQLGPIEWSVSLLIAGFLARLLVSPQVERRLGASAALLLRASALLAVGYLWVVGQGNQLDFSDVRVLSGLLGGAIPLYLPLVVVLTALYYAAPLVIALGTLMMNRGLTQPGRVIAAATALASCRLIYHLLSFTWGELAWGTWEKMMLESLLLTTWLQVLHGSLILLRLSERATASREIPAHHAVDARSSTGTA